MNEYWNQYNSKERTLNLGQTYLIKFLLNKSASDGELLLTRNAKLIFENSYFYTFEYKTKSGDYLRITIDKHDYRRNSSLIQEV